MVQTKSSVYNYHLIKFPVSKRMIEREDYTELTDGPTDGGCDDTTREVEQMGYFGWRPHCLERFNKPAVFAT